MTDKVQIKGIREGLLVSVVEDEGDWNLAEKELLSELDRQKSFLQGAKLILDVNEYGINAAAMGRLRDQISDHGLSLWGVLSRSPLTERSAQAMGLATRIHQTERQAEPADGHGFDPNSDAVLVRRTLRSGASITHTGHVTLIGDLNPGAEIIAGGDVIVWGRLRGLVHAGAEGNQDAVVCALDLAPTQLRIAGHIAIPPQERGQTSPEVAFVRDGQVIAEPWEPGKAIK
ncbi:MAG: septum site-determining protein MinC [Anaerolineales bacterium]|nr:septum site-determining protein MinC [Anaerolineales bacterium]